MSDVRHVHSDAHKMAGLPAHMFLSPRDHGSSAARLPPPPPPPPSSLSSLSSSSSSVTTTILAPSAPPPPPSVPVSHRDAAGRTANPLSVSQQFRLETSGIVGYNGLESEDRSSVTELLAYAITIKCPDKNYDSLAYEKPRWARVETDNGEYVLVLGGWHSLECRQMSLIWNFDVQAGEARNLVFMEVTLARPNYNRDVLELSLIMRWVGEKERRRRMAQRMSDGTPNADAARTAGAPYDSGAPNKKRGWSAAVADFMLGRDE